MLDIRYAALTIREGSEISEQQAEDKIATNALQVSAMGEGPADPILSPIDLSLGRPRVSLQDMIAITVALKSDRPIDIAPPTTQWPAALFPTAIASPATGNVLLPQESPFVADADDGMPSHVIEAIVGLQREVLLLRNELNFELWLSRENVKHIGRLHQDRILSKNAEAERQGLVHYFALS
jgi:hypothetical protein